ncbi:hypothetical protein V8C40DRAFT_238794 [Trichoderma camerunense]
MQGATPIPYQSVLVSVFKHAETQCRTLGEPDTSDCGCVVLVLATMAFNSTKYEAPEQTRGHHALWY